MDLLDELLRVTDQCAEHRISYALCGSLAVAIHGAPQCTIEIELLVPQGDLRRAKNAACMAGFDHELPNPSSVKPLTTHLIKVAGKAFPLLDLFVADQENENLLSDPLWIKHSGKRVAVISKSNLPKNEVSRRAPEG